MIPGIVSSSILSVSPLVEEYLTAEEFTHDWSNLTGWTTSGVQVNNNRLYGITGGNPVATAYPFSVLSGETVKLTAEITEASTSPGMRFIGLNFGGSNDGVITSLPNFVGIGTGGTTKRVAAYVGSNFTGVTTGQQYLSSTIATGTYRATVVIDDVNISLVVQTQDGDTEWYLTIPRSSAPNGGDITSIIVWNGGTNGTSGSYVKAIGAKKSLTPFITKTNAAGTIEGNTDFVMHRNTGSDTWRVQLPAVMDGTKPIKIVEFFHQASTGNRNSVMTESRWTDLRHGFMSNNYGLLSADDQGDRWGNVASVTNYKNLYDWIKGKVYINKLCLLGYSMGGLSTLNSISNDYLKPNVVTLICPVCDLIIMRQNPSFTSSIDLAWSSSSEATLIANSAGYDPMTKDKTTFAGIPYQFNIGDSDSIVPPADHTNIFEPEIEPYASYTEVNTLGTGHGPVQCFDPDVIITHFNNFT